MSWTSRTYRTGRPRRTDNHYLSLLKRHDWTLSRNGSWRKAGGTRISRGSSRPGESRGTRISRGSSRPGESRGARISRGSSRPGETRGARISLVKERV